VRSGWEKKDGSRGRAPSFRAPSFLRREREQRESRESAQIVASRTCHKEQHALDQREAGGEAGGERERGLERGL
jgi:hypothetical protein